MVLTGVADVPAYSPMTEAEYARFEVWDDSDRMWCLNRYLYKVEVGLYRLTWVTAYIPYRAYLRRAADDQWFYALVHLSRKPEREGDWYGPLPWDEAMLRACQLLAGKNPRAPFPEDRLLACLK